MTTLFEQVKKLMEDGEWRTLYVIAKAVKAPESSVSARVRELRSEKGGNRTVMRRLAARNLWEYRLVPNVNAAKTSRSTMLGGGPW